MTGDRGEPADRQPTRMSALDERNPMRRVYAGTFLFEGAAGGLRFLLPLGLPWNRLLGGLPSRVLPLAAVAAPALNLLLLWGLCRWRARR